MHLDWLDRRLSLILGGMDDSYKTGIKNMTIKLLAKLLPYFIIEKVVVKFNPDHATLSFTKDHVFTVDVWEIDDGVWIVKSSKVELMRSRKKLKSLIDQIDDRLEGFE